MAPISYGMSTSLVNSMAFTFIPIGSGTYSFAAFALTFAFVFAFGPMEAPQCVYMLFHFFAAFHVQGILALGFRRSVRVWVILKIRVQLD